MRCEACCKWIQPHEWVVIAFTISRGEYSTCEEIHHYHTECFEIMKKDTNPETKAQKVSRARKENEEENRYYVAPKKGRPPKPSQKFTFFGKEYPVTDRQMKELLEIGSDEDTKLAWQAALLNEYFPADCNAINDLGQELNRLQKMYAALQKAGFDWKEHRMWYEEEEDNGAA